MRVAVVAEGVAIDRRRAHSETVHIFAQRVRCTPLCQKAPQHGRRNSDGAEAEAHPASCSSQLLGSSRFDKGGFFGGYDEGDYPSSCERAVLEGEEEEGLRSKSLLEQNANRLLIRRGEVLAIRRKERVSRYKILPPLW